MSTFWAGLMLIFCHPCCIVILLRRWRVIHPLSVAWITERDPWVFGKIIWDLFEMTWKWNYKNFSFLAFHSKDHKCSVISMSMQSGLLRTQEAAGVSYEIKWQCNNGTWGASMVSWALVHLVSTGFRRIDFPPRHVHQQRRRLREKIVNEVSNNCRKRRLIMWSILVAKK